METLWENKGGQQKKHDGEIKNSELFLRKIGASEMTFWA